MKPKFSTGYLTPQAERNKTLALPKRADSHENLNIPQLNDSIFEKLMSCPIKRQLVLKLISSEKDNIEEYKRKIAQDERSSPKRKAINASPLTKLHKKYHCESPTALLRRRALEQQNGASPLSENHSENSESRSSSRQSNASSSGTSTVPFDKLLEGVIGYVEIRSKEQDRSQGVKALMRSMGATIKEQFTKGVTHVVFKDGSFNTYQKAKLMKVHMVSVLWVEAVRTSGTRVSERKFPAIGTVDYDHNVSSLCSQLQKDYEEIIREEVRQSLTTGTPLPSTKAYIDRRRTIMTPTYNLFSQESQSSQDREVTNINFPGKTYNFENVITGISSLKKSPEMSSDSDSELGAMINGTIVKRKKNSIDIPELLNTSVILNSIENLRSSDLTNLQTSNLRKLQPLVTKYSKSLNENQKNSILSESDMDLTSSNGCVLGDSIYNRKTPDITNQNHCEISAKPDYCQNLFNVPDENLYKRRTRKLTKKDIVSNKSSNISNDKQFINLNSNSTSSSMSSLQIADSSDDLRILSKNACVTNDNHLKDQNGNHTTSSMSALQVSSEKDNISAEKSATSFMSALQLSSAIDNGRAENSTTSSIIALQVSSEKCISAEQSNIPDKNSDCRKENAYLNNSNLQEPVTVQLTENNIPETDLMKRKSFNSSVNNSFSPINSNVINNIIQVLENNQQGDENVTKRRRRFTRVKGNLRLSTYSTRTNTILPVDSSITDSDESLANSNPINIVKPQNDTPNKVSSIKKFKTIRNSNAMITDIESLKENPGENISNTLKKAVKTNKLHSLLRPKRSCSSLEDLKKTAKKKEVNIVKVKDKNKTDTLKKQGISEVTKINHNSSKPGEIEINSDIELNKSRVETRSRRRTTHENLTPSEKIAKITDVKTKRNNCYSDESPGFSDGGGSKKNKRKLYNPNDSLQEIIVSDEEERQEKRIEIKNQKPDEGVFLKPISSSSNILLTKKAKEFIERNRMNLQTIMNKSSEESESDFKTVKISTKRSKKDKTNKRVSVNSDQDEQQELADEFLNRRFHKKRISKNDSTDRKEEKVTRRKSVRLSQVAKKKLTSNSSSSSIEMNVIPITPIIRRSTMEFQSKSESRTKSKLKIDKMKQPSIVCTKMHKDQIQVFNQIVKKLGGFIIEDEVTSKTTHLVAGEPKRTINMLRAITRGCWILKHEWLLKSLEERKWLSEEDYELTEFSTAVQSSRLQRQAFGPSFSMDIFQSCGAIYIARGSIPRCSDLRELVIQCQGKIVHIARNADIVVGEYVRQDNVTCVKELWILDSITFNKKMPLKKYILRSANGTGFSV